MNQERPALSSPKGAARRGFLRDALLDAGEAAANLLAERLDRFENAFAERPQPATATEALSYAMPAGMELYDRPYFRPPGAVPEIEFLEMCGKCRKCVDVCPEFCITPAQAHMGAPVGTPIMYPNDAPCTLCGECMDVCPSGALMPTPAEFVRIGEAHIIQQRCIAWGDTPCTACYDACPVMPNAIWFPEDRHGLVPVVEESHCTGCGLCVPACPTSPYRSIEVSLKPIEEDGSDDD